MADVPPVMGPDVGPGIIPGVRNDATADDGGDMSMDAETRWLSYDAIAAALKITPDSARRLVNRRKWPRKAGNDGKALVAFPVERLVPPPDSRPDVAPVVDPDVEADDVPAVQDVVGADARALIAYLKERVAELQAVVAGLQEDLVTLRVRASEADVLSGRVVGLETVLTAERRRADELRIDRDHMVELLSTRSTHVEVRQEPRGLFRWFKRAG